MKHCIKTIIILIAGVVMLDACQRVEEEISSDSGLQLSYSQDTVLFDTLITSVGSITKRFRIYNHNKQAINIDQLYLGLGAGSAYSIYVNGQQANDFSDEVIFGGDSLLVLVEVLIDPQDQDLPYLIKDSVVVAYNSNSDHVKLVSWGQDANFFNGETLDCNTTWSGTRPYVIYNYILVDTLCHLNVEKGVKILIDNNASIFVKGSLNVAGKADDKVVIRNTRLDPRYDIAPGQWDGIYFLEGTFDSSIDHAVIENGRIGIRIGNPDDDPDVDLTISNTSIRHMSNAGILAFTSDIQAWNVEIYNCQQYLVGNFIGGNYQYDHCTFSNFPNWFTRQDPSIQFSDNIVLEDQSLLTGDLNVVMRNSIIWGSEDEEFLISLTDQTNSTFNISQNMIRSTDETLAELDNIISQENNFPGFLDPFLFDYQIDSLSNARNLGLELGILHDIIGTARDDQPDLGAYERKDSIP